MSQLVPLQWPEEPEGSALNLIKESLLDNCRSRIKALDVNSYDNDIFKLGLDIVYILRTCDLSYLYNPVYLREPKEKKIKFVFEEKIKVPEEAYIWVVNHPETLAIELARYTTEKLFVEMEEKPIALLEKDEYLLELWHLYNYFQLEGSVQTLLNLASIEEYGYKPLIPELPSIRQALSIYVDIILEIMTKFSQVEEA